MNEDNTTPPVVSSRSSSLQKYTQIVQDTLHLTVDTVYFLHRTDVYK